MYVDYLKNEIETISEEVTANQIKKWNSFKKNLLEGIAYYENLFAANTLQNKTIQNALFFYKENLIEFRIPELEVA